MLHEGSVTLLIWMVLQSVLPQLLRTNFVIEACNTRQLTHVIAICIMFTNSLLKHNRFLWRSLHRNIHTQ